MLTEKKFTKIVLLIVTAVFVVVVLRNAWVSDDGYITLRTVDNFVNGYGLTWNVGERVQAYTHPLWMFLLAAVYMFTGEAYYTTIILSTVVAAIAALLLTLKVARSVFTGILGVAALTLSKGFIDYSTSGLENPLSHLGLVIFFLLFFSRDHKDRRNVFWLSLTAGLVGLTRLDNILLLTPGLVYVFWVNRCWRTLGTMLLGFAPLLAWRGFSLFYYGFLWPNTAYAKLSTGVPWTELTGQGLFYMWTSLRIDPLTVVIIVAGLTVPVLKKQWRLAVVSAGAALYIIYVIRIGGCFMAGRLLTAPFLLGVIALSQYSLNPKRLRSWIPVGLLLILGLTPTRSPIYTMAGYGGEDDSSKFGRGIVDERGWYFAGAGMLNASGSTPMPSHRYARLGRQQSGAPVAVRSTIGYYGYFVGPRTYVIDICGLADPLLARLPFDRTQTWRIGHIYRAIPDGYEQTVVTGMNFIRDPALSDYYDKLSFVVRGKLFSWSRVVTIINLNLGAYDHLLEKYEGSQSN